MALLNIFDIAGSALTAQSQRLNVAASNLANADSVTGPDGQPYRAKQVVFQVNAAPGAATGGVKVADVIESQAPDKLVYEPGNPLADAKGYVKMPNVDVVGEMVNTMSASRSYQANVEVLNTTTVLAGTGSEEGAVTTTTPFGVELQQAADKVMATITDKNGAVVRTIDIGELTAGVHSFTWDGTLTDGTTAPNGSYNVAISASNGGTQLVAQPLQFALVQGVIRGNNGNTLDLGTYGTTTLDEVRQII
ncbi:flagellar basal body rod protein FlgC [Escherichia coli]|nr:flagellar basal body rod protein FlgC [Escherichia coli]